MKNNKALFILTVASFLLLAACKKPKQDHNPQLIFKFVFDSTQTRLDNFGQPASMPAGHAGQNPAMNGIAAHYIELAANQYTALGTGLVLYQTPNSYAGGDTAIDFQQETVTPNNGICFQTDLKNVTAGTYQYLRVSLAYQNFDVKLHMDTTIVYGGFSVPINTDFPCTVASFVGFNSYITSYKVKTETISVNGSRKQGYWGFESTGNYMGYPYNYLQSGQAPVGSTTVVNPLFATSPIPAGSCVVTGPFNGNGLKITGTETSDITVTIALSVNHSFEWVEVVNDGKWEPSKGEYIVDMGVRGMIPTVQY
jgi:hypothetical protein